MRNLKKYKCTCGEEWYSSDSLEEESKYHADDEEVHKIKEIKKLSGSDYAEIWSGALEDGNRHSITDMPFEILKVLSKNILDKNVVNKIMKILCNKEIGL